MIQTMEFGKSGHLSTRLLFGAAAFYSTTDMDIVKKTMALVEEAGINHVDTAESYGESQKMLGPWLKHNRKKIFLATKTKYRGYKDAKEDIQRSLDLLCVDSVDLWQMHCLAEPEDWQEAKDPEHGVLRAFTEARDEGLVRYLGVTSHGMRAAEMMLQCLNDFPFDSVLTPYNYPIMQDPAYNKKYNKLVDVCAKNQVALQIIKTACKGPWPETVKPRYNTWYEPLDEQADIDTALGWALNQRNAFINSAADVTILPKIIKAVQSGRNPVSDQQMVEAAERIGMSNLF